MARVIRGLKNRAQGQIALMSALAEDGRLDEAREVAAEANATIEDISPLGGYNTAKTAFIRALAEAGLWDEISQVQTETRQWYPGGTWRVELKVAEVMRQAGEMIAAHVKIGDDSISQRMGRQRPSRRSATGWGRSLRRSRCAGHRTEHR